MEPKPEKTFIRLNIEQKISDSFGDYPVEVRQAIVEVFERLQKLWALTKNNSNSKDPNEMMIRNLLQQGLLYSPTEQIIECAVRELSKSELEKYREMMVVLDDYKGHTTYGVPPSNQPLTRIYLSLNDSLSTPDVITLLTKFLQEHINIGKISTWQYKFDSADNDGVFRFDPPFRDKGAAPIIYLEDGFTLEVHNYLLLLKDRYREAFRDQIAPFKYAPHGYKTSSWHISMESHALGESISRTPEQGLRKIVSEFLMSLNLTEQFTPIQLISPQVIRVAWKKACNKFDRVPAKPWLVNSRPAFAEIWD